ncbi:MAG: mucoidy inhibitor MuiA family protein [Planctomycetes bacterium]|nr:mucoidy inhibitor MuiA family protein [Planctomycetota bacterium]
MSQHDCYQTKGKLDAVTVYRGQALVTRLVEVPGPAGLREVVVTDLPEHVVPASIYAESADSAEVRSVRYRVRPVLQDVREEVRKLDEQIRELQDQIVANQRHAQRLGEQKTYLDKLEQFVAPTANVELTKGVLDAQTLKVLTAFLFEERKKLAEEELRLGREQRSLQEQLQFLQRQRDLLTSGSAQSAREAVVFVNLQQAGGRLRLRYLVNQATWSPSYNVRTEAGRSGVIVEYNASIQQLSGEDWTDVAMTLSTATPSLVAKAPVLTPLSIALSSGSTGSPAQGQAAMPADEGAYRDKLMGLRQEAEMKRSRELFLAKPGGADDDGDAYQADLSLNEAAGNLQLLELMAKSKVERKSDAPAAQPDEGISVTYEVATRTSLPSRADRQLIQIAALPMKGQFYKLAIPVLTSYVYEEAAVSNESRLVLLAGPISAYVAGQFVGHGQIPTVAVGESFTVGFGIDSSLRAVRELVEKTEQIQGGNRLVDFTYRVAIENFGSEAVKVRLLDRLPTVKHSEVRLTLVSPGKDLSDDATYQQTERKKGILRWELEVPSQAVATKALSLEYQFRLEYDKQMSILGLPLAAQ